MTVYQTIARQLIAHGNGGPPFYEQVCSLALTGHYVPLAGHDIAGDAAMIVEYGFGNPVDLEKIGQALVQPYVSITLTDPGRAVPLLPGHGVPLSWGTPPTGMSQIEFWWNLNNTTWVLLRTLNLPYVDPVLGQRSTWQHTRSWGANDYAVYRARFRNGSVFSDWSNQQGFAWNQKTYVIPYDVMDYHLHQDLTY